MPVPTTRVRDLLERLHDRHNQPGFIADDPVSIPHSFKSDDDREIAGFLVASISWGNRKSILASARRMMALLENEPAAFVHRASQKDLAGVRGFVHRTFNGEDLVDFIRGIRGLYERHGGIGRFMEARYAASGSVREVLATFRDEFFTSSHGLHSEKHVSSVERGSACKRLNMYLRWFVRRDDRGVDLGVWRGIPMSALYLPLDVHTARVGRELGLLARKQNDWKAVEEITAALREIDPEDPTRFDFALFGAGMGGELR